jgi:hypothetical protein
MLTALLEPPRTPDRQTVIRRSSPSQNQVLYRHHRKPYGYCGNMELERTSVHHAALTRDVPLGPMNDVSDFARHDPMRLPDMHLRQAGAAVATGTQERQRLDSGERGLDEPETRKFHANGQPESAADLPPRSARETRGQHEMIARDYIERSRGGSRKFTRSPSPQRVSIGGNKDRLPVMVKRGSRMPRASSIEPEEEYPRRYSTHGRERERPHRSSYSPAQYDYRIRSERVPSSTLSRPRLFELVCQTVSRDETSSEDAKFRHL